MKLAKLFGVTFFSFVTSLTASAAVPQVINYQGFLTGTGGAALDTTADLTFRIFDVASGGAALWTETQSVTSVDGLFTVLLGINTPIDETTIEGAERFLEVQLGASPFSPRTQLAASPYAIRIATVDGASGGIIIGDLALSSGNLNLDSSSATSGNILKGGTPFIHNFGVSNTFIGQEAGNQTMTGAGNTASGYQALENNTAGDFNTASGATALKDNTNGTRNTATGVGALLSNITGNDNTASGAYALHFNYTGNNNTASGVYALYLNTAGINNTASGAYALSANTGDFNTASGVYALYLNTTGNNNTASGAYALSANTGGFFNTAYGRNALSSNVSGYSNTASGAYALSANTSGFSNTAYGRNALSSNVSGDSNTAIGYFANVLTDNLNNATAIGAGASVNASNKIRLGNASVTVIEGQVAYTFTSDKNEKENFRPVNGEEVLEKIRGLELSSWNYQGHDPEKFRHYGPMAQDFYAAFGDDGVGKIGTETTLNTGDVTGILMIAVQALSEQNELAKTENQDLRKELKELREMVQKLSAQESTPDQTFSASQQ